MGRRVGGAERPPPPSRYARSLLVRLSRSPSRSPSSFLPSRGPHRSGVRGGSRMAGSHDQLWNDLIRQFPDAFLRLVDEELASGLDTSSLRLEPVEAFLDQPTGAERRMDLVGQISGSDGDEFLVHVEIERSFRSTVPGRIYLYNRLLGLRRGLSVHSYVLYLR